MNLLADEGVDRPIVEQLRQDGYTVLYVAEIAPSISDDEVLDRANQHNALLITADKDFGELVFRLGRINAGVVLLRLAGLQPATKAAIVSSVFYAHAAEMLNAFTVISPGIVRIRAKQ
jgi:predicted nuclease of predicted toxin-antitoxin system